MERIQKAQLFILMVNAASGTKLLEARSLAVRLAAELGYPDPNDGLPAAVAPALAEIKAALDGAPPAGETWG